MATNADIAEFKQVIEELEQNRKQLLDSQSIAHLGTWRLDVKTKKVFWTEELYKIYGFDPKLPPPDYTEHMKLFTPESWNTLSAALALTASEGIPYELELEMTKGNGDKGWLWVKGEAERDEKGRIIAVWGAAQDITEKTRLFKELKNQRDKTQKYLDVAGVMLLALDTHGTITMINRMGCEILEDEEKNILGKNWFDNFLPKSIVERTKFVL
jgi:PAS domain-containing protein